MKNVKNMKNGNIKIHLGYIIVFLLLIIVWLTSYIFMDSNYAGSLLNFAGTITSIILAVLAIMVTLLDSSNQKNSINEIKESVTSLQEVSNELKILLDQHNLDITNKITAVGNYDNRISELTQTMQEVLNRATSVNDSGESVNADQLKELVDEMNITIQNSNEKRKQLINEYIPGVINPNSLPQIKYIITIKKADKKNYNNFVKVLLDMLAAQSTDISHKSEEEEILTVKSPFNYTLDTIINLANSKGIQVTNIEKLNS